MKRIVLHIGLHKTGSSCLQETFSHHRYRLLERGIRYPRSALGLPGQQELAWSLVRRPQPHMRMPWSAERVWDRLLEDFERRPGHTLLLSSEDLGLLWRNRQALDFIHQRLAPWPVTVIAYLRDPVDYVLSLYGHRLRKGEVDVPFMTFFRQQLGQESGRFDLTLVPWENRFGRDHITVRQYAPASFSGGDLIQDFLQAAGLEAMSLAPTGRINASVHPWLSNSHRRVLATVGSRYLRGPMLRALWLLGERLPPVSARAHLLSPGDEAELSRHFIDCRRRVRERYGIDFS